MIISKYSQRLIVATFISCYGYSQALHAHHTTVTGDGRTASSVTLAFENDIFTGEDSGYTNGFALLFAKGRFPTFNDEHIPAPIARLVQSTWIGRTDHRHRARLYSLVQTMQTPEDISVESLQVDQLPYAGLLLGSLFLYAFDTRVVDQLSFSVGFIGSMSLAKESQVLVHSITRSEDPKGWDNQLSDELVFQVQASRGYRFGAGRLGDTTEVDFLARGNVAAGTLASSVSLSLISRIGRELAFTFPVASLLPNRQTNSNVFTGSGGWFAFVGAELALVANDIQVNGNTFNNSHSVDLDHTRERVSAGLSATIGSLGLTLIYADVPGNSDGDSFGGISFTYRTR